MLELNASSITAFNSIRHHLLFRVNIIIAMLTNLYTLYLHIFIPI